MLTDKEKKRIWDQWLLDEGLLVPDKHLKGCVAWTDRMLDIYAGMKDPKGEYTRADLIRIQANLWKQAEDTHNGKTDV